MLFWSILSVYLMFGSVIAVVMIKKMTRLVEKYESGVEVTQEEGSILDELSNINKQSNNTLVWLGLLTVVLWLPALIFSKINKLLNK